MTPVPVTLLTAAASVAINIWLGRRIAAHRHQFKVSVGDGGHEPLLRRMRAQANFIESAPFFLILLLALELSGANRIGLGAVAAVFVIARVAHAYGMEGGELGRWRTMGIMASMLAIAALTVWALVCAAGLCLSR